MEIRYLENSQIDYDKWDHCIAKSFNGMVYAYSWYLDAVCDKWHALVQGDYVRVFPLAIKKKFGVNLIYQPFFTQQLGLFSKELLSKEILYEFLSAIPSNYKYVEICLNTHNKVSTSNFIQTKHINLELDLINSYEKIQSKYSKNLIRNLKKAKEHKLNIAKNIKPDEVIRLFRANKGKSIKHLKEADYLRFKRLVYSAVYKGMCDVYGVYDIKNELVAGAIFIRSHHRASFIFSGLSDPGKELGAMPYLIDRYIQDYSNRHLTFDFEGCDDPQLVRFYKSFGAVKTNYFQITINRLSFIHNTLFKLYRTIKKLYE